MKVSTEENCVLLSHLGIACPLPRASSSAQLDVFTGKCCDIYSQSDSPMCLV